VANLLQTLSNDNSPVLSSPSVVAALKKASPNDIVQMSRAATQLEGVDAMFGLSSSSTTDTTNNLPNLADILTGSSGAASTSPGTSANALLSSAALAAASPADQLAYYQSASQAALTQGMFSAGAFSNPSGSLINVMG
jgi:hypothetical protein